MSQVHKVRLGSTETLYVVAKTVNGRQFHLNALDELIFDEMLYAEYM